MPTAEEISAQSEASCLPLERSLEETPVTPGNFAECKTTVCSTDDCNNDSGTERAKGGNVLLFTVLFVVLFEGF